MCTYTKSTFFVLLEGDQNTEANFRLVEDVFQRKGLTLAFNGQGVLGEKRTWFAVEPVVNRYWVEVAPPDGYDMFVYDGNPIEFALKLSQYLESRTQVIEAKDAYTAKDGKVQTCYVYLAESANSLQGNNALVNMLQELGYERVTDKTNVKNEYLYSPEGAALYYVDNVRKIWGRAAKPLRPEIPAHPFTYDLDRFRRLFTTGEAFTETDQQTAVSYRIEKLPPRIYVTIPSEFADERHRGDLCASLTAIGLTAEAKAFNETRVPNVSTTYLISPAERTFKEVLWVVPTKETPVINYPSSSFEDVLGKLCGLAPKEIKKPISQDVSAPAQREAFYLTGTNGQLNGFLEDWKNYGYAYSGTSFQPQSTDNLVVYFRPGQKPTAAKMYDGGKDLVQVTTVWSSLLEVAAAHAEVVGPTLNGVTVRRDGEDLVLGEQERVSIAAFRILAKCLGTTATENVRDWLDGVSGED